MKVEVHTDIPYMTDSLTGSLIDNNTLTSYNWYLPSEIKSSDLLIWIHGGAWVSGDKEEFTGLAKNLAEKHQIATVLLNYRLSNRPNESDSQVDLNQLTIQHPIHTQDCLTGILHILSNLSFNFTARDVYLGGHSAGGQITGLIGLDYHQLMTDTMKRLYPNYKPLLARIRGVFVTEGIFDLVTFSQQDPTYAPNYIIPAFGDTQSDWLAASPQHLKLSPLRQRELLRRPIKYHLIHSTTDPLVDPSQSLQFQHKLLALGIATHYDLLNLGDHDDVPMTSTVLHCLAKFINSSS